MKQKNTTFKQIFKLICGPGRKALSRIHPNKRQGLWYQILILLLGVACGQSAPPSQTELPISESGFNLNPPTELETVEVAQVVDGDTIELADGQRVRYIGINTPERDQPYYDEATELNRQLLQQGTVQIEYDFETEDQYGRTLAYLWVDDRLVNLEIVNAGYANAFFIPPNTRYETEIQKAEQQAKQAERGIWQSAGVALKIIHVEANAPGSDNENPNGEWIEIKNQGSDTINMNGYNLKDAANNFYEFNNFSLTRGQTVRLYSGTGRDNDNELYWGLVDQSVWNNKGDTAFLRNSTGALVDSYQYSE
ncbi:thermonuclease family protein [Anaerolineales bacterium HSG25]|nr:thermonuclease family protein [Anaerolineales bacterium HSG25]